MIFKQVFIPRTIFLTNEQEFHFAHSLSQQARKFDYSTFYSTLSICFHLSTTFLVACTFDERESVNIFTEDGNNDPKDIYDLKIRSISRVCPLFEALLNNQIYIKPAAETFQG